MNICIITTCSQFLGRLICISNIGLLFFVRVCFQMSCHPELNQYIQDTLHCVKPLIEKVRHDMMLTEVNLGNTCHLSSTWMHCWSLSFPSQNDAEKVVVVIMDKEHHPVERFVFEISQPPLLSIRFFPFFLKKNNISADFVIHFQGDHGHFTNWLWFCCYSSDTLLSHVEQLLRAFILKISVCDAVLNNNPPGSATYDYAKRSTRQTQSHTYS